jgi:hypothetical protein
VEIGVVIAVVADEDANRGHRLEVDTGERRPESPARGGQRPPLARGISI